MLAVYAKKSNIATLIWASAMGAFILIVVIYGRQIPDAVNHLSQLILAIFLVSYFYSFYAYAKGRGYSASAGIVASFFWLIGLLVLRSMPDKHPGGVETPVEPIKPAAKPKRLTNKIATAIFWTVVVLFALLFLYIAIRNSMGLNDR